MNRKVTIALLLGVGLVVATVVVFVVFNGSKNTSESNTTTINQASNTPATAESNVPTPEPTVTAQASRYVAYSEADFAKTDGTKLLFFHAPWCPQCKALDSDITKNISSDNGVTIYKVDYDSNQALRQKYGVTLQTTVVKVDSSGNLVKKYVAYNEPTYANIKANLL